MHRVGGVVAVGRRGVVAVVCHVGGVVVVCELSWW